MPLTLLIVDDDVVDREAVRRALRSSDVDAVLVETGDPEQAVERARSGIDCILLDYQLPGTDGVTVLRRLRAEQIDVPVIALTGRGDEHTAVELMKAGAADYLPKQALTPDRLERSIRHALTLAAAERERRALLRREQAAREEAQAANRVKDEFLATLSHELRTPLNAILGWTKMLVGGQLDADTARRGLATIERNVLLQVKLIDDLLDVSRIVSGKLVVEKADVSLSAIVHAVLESHRPLAESAGLTLTDEVVGEERVVAGDSSRLEQVITNLVGNAIKFTPRGGRVEVVLAYDEQQARLTVRDTGVGIAPGFLPHVFERFRQADTGPSRQRGGLGLGLAIVRHLVELHAGQVTVESGGLEQGATFHVLLPTIPRNAPPPRAEARPLEQSGTDFCNVAGHESATGLVD